MSYEELIQIEAISAIDQNSNMPFLRYEFSKFIGDLIMMTLFTKITHNYDQTKNKKLNLKPVVVKCLPKN